MFCFIVDFHKVKVHLEVSVSEDMVGHRRGKVYATEKVSKHGGKMQKELEHKKKEGEIAAAQSAKATTEPAAKK